MTPEQVLRSYYENANEINAITARRQPTFEEKVRLAKMIGTHLKQNIMGRQPQGAWFKNRGYGVPGENPDRKREEAIYAEPKYNWAMGEVDAFHGSPRSGLKKLSTEFIGTGEGSAAFGWGLYFSDLGDVAKTYIRGRSRHLQDEFGNIWDGVYHAIKGNKKEGIKRIQAEIDYIKGIPAGPRQTLSQPQVDAIKKYEKVLSDVKADKIDSGALYKVKLFKDKDPSEYTWLDWDKPAPKSVVDKIFKAVENTWKKNPDKKIMGYYSDEGDQLLDFLNKNAEHSGQALYKTLELEGDAKKASLFLNKLGVDGIRYPAGTLSGVKNSKAKNYVVFDDNAVTIEKAKKF